MRWFTRAAFTAVLAAAPVLAAFAETVGQPVPWGINFQPSASPVKTQIHDFHELLLVIITLITIFVLGLLVYVMWRFRASAHPHPTRTTHNTLLEVAWTAIPVMVLVLIAIKSFPLLYYEDRAVAPEMTIKVVGKQWYWTYEYPDAGGLAFDSYMVQKADLKPGQPWLLEADNHLVVPVGATVRVLVAGNDVMHSFFVPALGVQIYAVPGRLNETWFRADREGVFYGQCNQICGVNHAFMPIAVTAVSKEAFAKWLEDAKKKFAQGQPPSPPTALAAARLD
jgi:cytochrome c oxidase subunit 2